MGRSCSTRTDIADRSRAGGPRRAGRVFPNKNSYYNHRHHSEKYREFLLLERFLAQVPALSSLLGFRGMSIDVVDSLLGTTAPPPWRHLVLFLVLGVFQDLVAG